MEFKGLSVETPVALAIIFLLSLRYAPRGWNFIRLALAGIAEFNAGKTAETKKKSKPKARTLLSSEPPAIEMKPGQSREISAAR